MKKIILVGFLFLFIPTAFARAAIIFTEIMYDPQGTDTKHEWVEIHNENTTESITLVGGSGNGSWRFNDGSNHYLSASTTYGSMTISADGYAILADDVPTFISDHPGFSGTVIGTSIDLPDTNGTAKIIDGGGNVLDSVDYSKTQGAFNDGNSLQKNSSGIWVSAQSTPGYATLDSSASDINQNNSQNSTNTSTNSVNNSASSTDVSNQSVSINSPQANILVPKTAIAGVPIFITPSLFGVNVTLYTSKSLHFTFGDGSERYDSFPNEFEHTFLYPGTYVVNFEYLKNSYSKSKTGNLYSRKIIEVFPAPVEISKVNIDGSIEISNPGSREIDMSDWVLRSILQPEIYFIIPSGTVILPGKKIELAKSITGFSFQNLKEIELSIPSGTAVSVYDGDGDNDILPTISKSTIENINNISKDKPVSDVKKNNTTAKSVKKTESTKNFATTLSEKDLQQKNNISGVDDGLSAEALLSTNDNFAKTEAQNNNDSKYPIIPLSIGIIGLIIVSVFMVRSLHNKFDDGLNYFDIENTSAKEYSDGIKIIDD